MAGAETEIREGFLCPMCMKDLGTITDLQQHFDDAHANEDKAVVQQLKGLFGKAKRKILGKDREESPLGMMLADTMINPMTAVNVDVGGIDPSMWEPQEIGAVRSYTDSFRSVRDARIDRFVVETNKLLIRLDKLMGPDAPMDPSKRKAFEKTVVHWAPDSDVNLCTSCGRSFTLTRRRHHCRLCGGIICNNCSQFLPCGYAKKLTDPAFRYDGEGFHRSSSNSSLNSIMSPEGEPQIRTCTECRNLLERRDQQMEQRNTKPMIVLLYEKMKAYMDEVEQHLVNYIQMADSLNSGESTYSLMQAQTLRLKIMRLYEGIDSLSKRIGALGLDMQDPPPPRVLQLQRMVRSYAGSFLQENLMGLAPLPTEEQLQELQQQRALEAQRRIEAEKREREQRRKEEQRRQQEREQEKERERQRQASVSPGESPKKEGAESIGWIPSEVSISAGSEEDPMIQQMNIIRGYVKQARQAQKWDEVSMLEDNLRELQQEYWRQHKPPQNS